MQVQRISNNNYNANFGALQTIKREGYFSNDSFTSNEVIKNVLNSDALKKFGEKYDFNVHLFHGNRTFPMSWAGYHVCELYLSPVNTESTKKLPVNGYLDLVYNDDILPGGRIQYNYVEEFIRKIKELKYEDIIEVLRQELKHKNIIK